MENLKRLRLSIIGETPYVDYQVLGSLRKLAVLELCLESRYMAVDSGGDFAELLSWLSSTSISLHFMKKKCFSASQIWLVEYVKLISAARTFGAMTKVSQM